MWHGICLLSLYIIIAKLYTNHKSYTLFYATPSYSIYSNILSAFIEGLGHFQTGNFQTSTNRAIGWKYGKATSFLCLLFHLSLNLYNNGNSRFAKDCKEKRCNLYNSNVYFVRFVQLVFDTLDVCFFVFLSLLFRQYLPIIIGYSYHKIT